RCRICPHPSERARGVACQQGPEPLMVYVRLGDNRSLEQRWALAEGKLGALGSPMPWPRTEENLDQAYALIEKLTPKPEPDDAIAGKAVEELENCIKRYSDARASIIEAQKTVQARVDPVMQRLLGISASFFAVPPTAIELLERLYPGTQTGRNTSRWGW